MTNFIDSVIEGTPAGDRQQLLTATHLLSRSRGVLEWLYEVQHNKVAGKIAEDIKAFLFPE